MLLFRNRFRNAILDKLYRVALESSQMWHFKSVSGQGGLSSIESGATLYSMEEAEQVIKKAYPSLKYKIVPVNTRHD